ncbi:hypothetical protein DL765_009131 [Monosporascus sp. GIB2]|nr:hypothetical protein DL765_009131 [Monosporascus sp. GIB2]
MGHHNRHFGGDAYANSGVWGPPTSAANFCEEDYIVTRYIAEFVNSLSNLAYIYMALRLSKIPGLKSAWRGLDSMSTALFLVGVTSMFYHATLLQYAQFSDDLSMLLIAACILRRLCVYQQTVQVARFITATIASIAVAASVIYVRSGDILLHMLAFSALVHLIWPRTLFLIYSHRRHPDERSRMRKSHLGKGDDPRLDGTAPGLKLIYDNAPDSVPVAEEGLLLP